MATSDSTVGSLMGGNASQFRVTEVICRVSWTECFPFMFRLGLSQPQTNHQAKPTAAATHVMDTASELTAQTDTTSTELSESLLALSAIWFMWRSLCNSAVSNLI